MERGAVYVAIGEQYQEMAQRSAESLRRYHADMPIVAVLGNGQLATKAFDRVIYTDEPDPHVVKAKAVAALPFEQTLFLDADTWVCRSLDDAFAVLDRFDVAGVQDRYVINWKLDNVPRGFPEINTGVLFVRRNEAARAMLARWVELTRINPERFKGKQGDQGAFREALYYSEARVATLPPIYNVRLGALNYLCRKAAVLHSRDLDLEQVEKVINRNGRMRVYNSRTGAITEF